MGGHSRLRVACILCVRVDPGLKLGAGYSGSRNGFRLSEDRLHLLFCRLPYLDLGNLVFGDKIASDPTGSQDQNHDGKNMN